MKLKDRNMNEQGVNTFKNILTFIYMSSQTKLIINMLLILHLFF